MEFAFPKRAALSAQYFHRRLSAICCSANCWPNLLKNPSENIRLSDELRGTKEELLRIAQEFGLEGLVAKKPKGRWGLGITPAVMKRCEWVKPVLIGQVKFTEWTHDGQLHQPVYLGLRTDKDAKDVVRE